MNEELALRAVLALEAANQTSWAELAGVMVRFLQCRLIYSYGLLVGVVALLLSYPH